MGCRHLSIQVYIDAVVSRDHRESNFLVYPDLALLAVANLTMPCVLLGEDPAPNTTLYSLASRIRG